MSVVEGLYTSTFLSASRNAATVISIPYRPDQDTIESYVQAVLREAQKLRTLALRTGEI